MPDVDLWSESFRADPYPTYELLRTESPVHRTDGPMGSEIWLITGSAEARAALADQRLAKHIQHAPQWMYDIGAIGPNGERPVGTNMLNSDPPDHTRLRKLVTKAFTRRRIENLRPRVQEITDSLLDELTHGEHTDLLQAVAFPLPITVICELLGVPENDRTQFRAWTQTILSAEANEAGLQDQFQAQHEFAAYLSELIERTRANLDLTVAVDNQPHLVAALVAAADGTDQLSEEELVGSIELLLVAGHETTVNLIGNGMLTLLRHPDQLALLREQPELLPSAIEELLRYDGPVERATPRFTVEDVEIGGVTIPAGSFVSISLAAADRSAPSGGDALDITRSGHGHLAFGHGIHYCLGASLARLEGQIAIGSLLARFPDVSLACAPEELRWRPQGLSGIIRGLEALPLKM